MERFAWRAHLKPGMTEEYIRRHNEVWPEMTKMLNDAGIHNYTIWRAGNDLFGYYEAEEGLSFAAHVQSTSPVVAKWNEYMSDVMEMTIDPDTGTIFKLEQVFFHE